MHPSVKGNKNPMKRSEVKMRISETVGTGVEFQKRVEKTLIKSYLEEKKSLREIAKELGWKLDKVYYWIKKLGIFIRTNSEAKKGKHFSLKTEFKKGNESWNKGKQGIYSAETIAKIRKARKKQKLPTCRTKPELQFIEICERHNLPFKYTGDGTLWIRNINPDFVHNNEKKIAVEIFGNYWHSSMRKHLPYYQTEEGRRNILQDEGWKLIVLWESELKGDENLILGRLSECEYKF